MAVVAGVFVGCAVQPAARLTSPATTTTTVVSAAAMPAPPSTARPLPPRPSRSLHRPPSPSPPRTEAETGSWQALVGALPWPAPLMMRVIRCESGGNPNARNRSGATGLLQIMGGPTDPEANIRLGFAMWQRRGLQPWEASRSCWSGVP